MLKPRSLWKNSFLSKLHALWLSQQITIPLMVFISTFFFGNRVTPAHAVPPICSLVGVPQHARVVHHDNKRPHILSLDTLLLQSVPLQLQVVVRQLFDHKASSSLNREFVLFSRSFKNNDTYNISQSQKTVKRGTVKCKCVSYACKMLIKIKLEVMSKWGCT